MVAVAAQRGRPTGASRQLPSPLHRLCLTVMSPTYYQAEVASAHDSPPATGHGVDVENIGDSDDDDASSEVSMGGNLRVQNLLIPSCVTFLTTS